MSDAYVYVHGCVWPAAPVRTATSIARKCRSRKTQRMDSGYSKCKTWPSCVTTWNMATTMRADVHMSRRRSRAHSTSTCIKLQHRHAVPSSPSPATLSAAVSGAASPVPLPLDFRDTKEKCECLLVGEILKDGVAQCMTGGQAYSPEIPACQFNEKGTGCTLSSGDSRVSSAVEVLAMPRRRLRVGRQRQNSWKRLT